MCYRVSLRKVRAYLKREDPAAPSQLSECLGAGTGCGWCVPFLDELHRQHKAGEEAPDIPGVDPVAYGELRKQYRETGRRDGSFESGNG